MTPSDDSPTEIEILQGQIELLKKERNRLKYEIRKRDNMLERITGSLTSARHIMQDQAEYMWRQTSALSAMQKELEKVLNTPEVTP